MIVYDLSCDSGHRFEGWFGSSHDFFEQRERGLLSCPQCGSAEVEKAPMAPAVGRKGNQRTDLPARSGAQPAANHPQPVANHPLPAHVAEALTRLAVAQAEALKSSKWVGTDFAETSRAMHYGEREAEAVHGQVSVAEAQELLEEGIPVAPLPFPVAPPEDLN